MTPGGELCRSCDQAVKRPVWLTALTVARELQAAEERGCWRERDREREREREQDRKNHEAKACMPQGSSLVNYKL